MMDTAPPITTTTTTINTQLLGQGSFGRVEKVCCGDKLYARKTMLREEHDEGLSFSSLRECDIYSRFMSSFMPSVFRVEIENHQVCLWMGLAEKSLAQFIAEQPPFRDRVQIMGQVLWSVLNFLNYIHSYNVLHRDLKPDNILLQRNNNNSITGNSYKIYVSDMGAGRWVYPGLKLTGGMGTRCYRAPEMDTNKYGKPSEIYGLGVTAIHLLHGFHPVQGHNPETPPSKWQSTLRVYQPYISANLYDLLRRLILAKPQDRITVKQALEHDYFQNAVIPAVPKMQGIPPPGDYTFTLSITHEERRAWVEYIVDLGLSYGCGVWTVTHAVHLWDDFLSVINIKIFQQHKTQIIHNPLELYGCVAIWIVSKYFEEYAVALTDLIHQCQQRFTTEHFIDMEEYMIQMLRFRIVRRPPLKEIANKMDCHVLKYILGSSEYLHGQSPPLRQLRSRVVTARTVF